MKITLVGTAIVFLACITYNHAQLDFEKGLGLIKKFMPCFGKFDISNLSKLKIGAEGGGTILKGFNSCKGKPMEQLVDCVGRQMGLNSTIMNCLQGVLKDIKL
ncbi:uncharacterized protein LOC144118348 [Amblyomma americanum]